MDDTVTNVQFPSAKLDELPVAIRQRIIDTYGEERDFSDGWILIPKPNSVNRFDVEDAVNDFTKIAETFVPGKEEQTIERLMKLIALGIKPSKTDFELELRNAELRTDYLVRNKLLTSNEIHDLSGCKSANLNEPASRWKREGKIFAVQNLGTKLYPSFQFLNRKPRPIIKSVLDVIRDDFSDWQIAFWFESGNGWLDGEEPQDCLDQVDDLLQAAEYAVG